MDTGSSLKDTEQRNPVQFIRENIEKGHSHELSWNRTANESIGLSHETKEDNSKLIVLMHPNYCKVDRMSQKK